MKRRNFFSKIAKGLLGIGIVTALPTPEVETAPEITPDTELDLSLSESWKMCITDTNDSTYTISGVNAPKGIVWDGKRYIVTGD